MLEQSGKQVGKNPVSSATNFAVDQQTVDEEKLFQKSFLVSVPCKSSQLDLQNPQVNYQLHLNGG